jgi:DNA-binding protein YbaB
MSYYETLTDSMICAINDATTIMDEPLTVENILHVMNMFDRVQAQLRVVQAALDDMQVEAVLAETRTKAQDAIVEYLKAGGAIGVNTSRLNVTETIVNERQMLDSLEFLC